MGKIGQWLQVSANIGILCGLILVGVQINQATGIVAAQFSTQNYESTMQSFDVVMGEELAGAWSQAMVNSPDLSDTDLVVIDAYLMREWLNNTKNQLQAELGYGPGNTDLSLKKWTNQYLGNETALRWWKTKRQSGRLESNPTFAQRIDEELEKLGSDQAQFHTIFLHALRN